MPKCKRSGHADKEDEDSRGADVCDSYGWSFPNPNPSDRRSHKRVCGTNEGDRPGNDDAPHKIHLDVEHVSDPNAAPTGMCVAESSVDGAIQPMTSEENNHSDETKHIAENPNPNGSTLLGWQDVRYNDTPMQHCMIDEVHLFCYGKEQDMNTDMRYKVFIIQECHDEPRELGFRCKNTLPMDYIFRYWADYTRVNYNNLVIAGRNKVKPNFGVVCEAIIHNNDRLFSLLMEY